MQVIGRPWPLRLKTLSNSIQLNHIMVVIKFKWRITLLFFLKELHSHTHTKMNPNETHKLAPSILSTKEKRGRVDIRQLNYTRHKHTVMLPMPIIIIFETRLTWYCTTVSCNTYKCTSTHSPCTLVWSSLGLAQKVNQPINFHL